MEEFIPSKLPLKIELETKEIFKKIISANRALAKLNGVCKIIPNQNILINSLVLQEAKDLNQLEIIGIVKSIKIGKSKYFINNKLFKLLQRGIFPND